MSRTADIERKLATEAHSAAAGARGTVRVMLRNYKDQDTAIQSSKAKLHEYRLRADVDADIEAKWTTVLNKAEEMYNASINAARKWTINQAEDKAQAWGESVYQASMAVNDMIMIEMSTERPA